MPLRVNKLIKELVKGLLGIVIYKGFGQQPGFYTKNNNIENRK